MPGFDPVAAELAAFARNPGFNLAEKCLKAAQLLEYPDLDVAEYVSRIGAIGMSLKESVGGARDPQYLASSLSAHLYENLGFAGSTEDYYNPRNNFLNEVIDRREGIPITLAVLCSEVAKFAGLDLRVAGFPGRALLRHPGGMVLDPFEDARPVDGEGLQRLLDASFGGLEMRPGFLDELPPEQVVARIARNLKHSYTQSFAYDRALHCVNAVLEVDETPEDVRDKGVLEGRMLNWAESVEHLNRYLEMSPNADDVDHVLELIREARASL